MGHLFSILHCQFRSLLNDDQQRHYKFIYAKPTSYGAKELASNPVRPSPWCSIVEFEAPFIICIKHSSPHLCIRVSYVCSLPFQMHCTRNIPLPPRLSQSIYSVLTLTLNNFLLLVCDRLLPQTLRQRAPFGTCVSVSPT